ncbi:hypothetical protein AtNW77_Chr5g0099561 [Arabidopsis thaliana]|uniref:Protein GOLVEN 9 n=4 Tax=Arabidopsis TaxID=3701 RepID=GLV9_ARATH|nr:uncharacterized protein AT5G15725 [Arabidopsis thaliana]F4KB79.1 RecName: Full=Protein GOLVEN 9; Contains: RecName: Full=GLV9p; Flags: Precursor [Arabidopsis thaliana]KAG7602376.1 hypothetical protein ISN45_At05g014500 [Arabidopsis thaliana x Arabidopsis arenosa]KAG7609319.1 hypothetical protein ISN44_As05g014450 [Arabidopsis suecica]AED92197.1 transmembrane protein [Arabidopsis thaliana]OAO91793.1 GLV9 [Arabidopsis thaliana]CAA0402831.1 unnamed protein product [Arabidopsis thaliana]|eukprot:NP_568319.1 transmembrane protein [Arabidopsis thaliana]
MKKTSLKLMTLVLGFCFVIYLLQGPRGGSRNGDLLIARKLISLEPIETKNAARSLKDSISTDLEEEVDRLMEHEYPSPVKPRKRTPVHNGVRNRH